MATNKHHTEPPTPRRWLNAPKLHISPEMRSIVLDRGACGVSSVSDEAISMMIRRKGQEEFILRYDSFDHDDHGRMRFVLDDNLFNLPAGRYEASLHQGCTHCSTFEIVLDEGCDVNVQSVQAVMGESYTIRNGEMDSVSDIFDCVNVFEAELCAVLEADATTIPLSNADRDNLCDCVLCRSVELVLDDGVKSEIVLFSGCSEGLVRVTRGVAGTSPRKFPVGTKLAFTWTPANVSAACEGCP